MRRVLLLVALFSSALVACDNNKKDEESGQEYSFTTASKIELKSSATTGGLNFLGTSPPMCADNLCYTPSALTGKYYGAGVMIQSGGSGMMGYFGQASWSSTTGTSTSYEFDFNAPVPSASDLICCAGKGDLANENTYLSDAVYMFGYVDASFEIPLSSGAHGDALGQHTVRFVLADGAVTGAGRGDLLYSDGGTFKWMDANGALKATRPTDAIVMDTEVVNWMNPYGTDMGNQSIPVLSTSINPPATGGVFQVSETELKTAARIYSFDFDVTGFVTFPTLLKADVGMLDSRKALLTKIHIQGLPHSKYLMSDAGNTTLTITAP